MGRIHRLLNSLRDETGAINPTRYRLSEDGRSLVYDAMQEAKTPIRFSVERKKGGRSDVVGEPGMCSVSTPFLRLENLSWMEMMYLFQRLMASPYITRCNVVQDGGFGCSNVCSVCENADPFAKIKRGAAPYIQPLEKRKEAIDLAPGSADFQLAVSLKKQIREEKNRPHRLRRRGIVAFLQTLGLDYPDADFYLQCVHHHINGIGTKDGLFCIKVRDNQRLHASHVQPMSPEAFEVMYEGDDPTLFAHAIADLYARYPCASKFHHGHNNSTGCGTISFASSSRNTDDETPPRGALAHWLAEAAHPTRPKPTPKPDAARLFLDQGLLQTLNLLNCEPARFALDFEHNPKTGLYTIELLPARQWTIRLLPSIYLYKGTDREVFVRAVAEFMGSAYREKATALFCRQYEWRGNCVHVQIRLRRENHNTTDIKAPLTGWLEEAARLPTASESDQR